MKFFMIALMVFTSFQASADYFKGGIGYNVGGKVSGDHPTLSIPDEDLDSTFLAPLLLAYGFEMVGDVHGEVEIAYRKHEYKDDTATAEPTFLTGAFNIVGYAPAGGVILTGGAGAFFGNFDSDNSALGKGTGLGLQVFGGFDFQVNEGLKLGGELRYMTTVTDIGLDNDVDASYDSMSVLFNAKFEM